jgi:hypothetical protein
MFAWALGREALVSNGLAVFAPETAKTTNPYHVSPETLEVTETASLVSLVGAMAYHSWMNWPPPICT